MNLLGFFSCLFAYLYESMWNLWNPDMNKENPNGNFNTGSYYKLRYMTKGHKTRSILCVRGREIIKMEFNILKIQVGNIIYESELWQSSCLLFTHKWSYYCSWQYIGIWSYMDQTLTNKCHQKIMLQTICEWCRSMIDCPDFEHFLCLLLWLWWNFELLKSHWNSGQLKVKYFLCLQRLELFLEDFFFKYLSY